jgi:hypothetical protein
LLSLVANKGFFVKAKPTLSAFPGFGGRDWLWLNRIVTATRAVYRLLRPEIASLQAQGITFKGESAKYSCNWGVVFQYG